LWLLLNKTQWSVFTTSLEPTLSKIRDERKPRHRLASLGNPKEKCSLLFGFARDQFFLKKERTFFFGILPSKYSGSVAGLQFGLGRAKQFVWGKGFALPRLFSRAEEGSGEESARASLSDFFGGGFYLPLHCTTLDSSKTKILLMAYPKTPAIKIALYINVES